ncbi:MAG: TRAP transporter substrate-binding protein [Alphaproteobacteria bacterium]|nr:TRAP transporter substrate-binding protein [Alphaproteobacteria bacterium]
MNASTRRRFSLALATGTLAAPMINGRASAQAVKLILSHHVPTTHLFHATSENFAKYVAEGTKGQVTVDIKPASQLFNLRTAAEALQLGTLDLAWTDLGTHANWQPQFGFTSLPFLFSDYAHGKKVLHGALGQQIAADIKSTIGNEVLALGASGFRVFVGRREIKSADDCRGMKLRVPEIPLYIEMARLLGTNPTPIPAAEVYTALQTGVVDAMESPPDLFVTNKMWEVAQHATRTFHIFTEGSLFASTRSSGMKGLSAANLQVVREAAKRAVEAEMWEANLKEQNAALQTLGERLKMVASPDVASFRAKTAPMIQGFVAKAGAKAKAYVEAVQALA